jgi:hypothetical protein
MNAVILNVIDHRLDPSDYSRNSKFDREEVQLHNFLIKFFADI